MKVEYILNYMQKRHKLNMNYKQAMETKYRAVYINIKGQIYYFTTIDISKMNVVFSVGHNGISLVPIYIN